MRIYLSGNPFLYDVEQTAMSLMPERSPRAFPDSSEPFDRSGDYGVSKLSYTKHGVAASFTLCLDGKSCTETCREKIGENATEEEVNSLARHSVRRSFFKAYASLTGERPAWGAVAGVRPAKLARKLLSSGLEPEEAVNRLKRGYYVREDKARFAVTAAVHAAELLKDVSDKDAALYVGIPFCPTRCAYCSFISKTAPSANSESVVEYLSCLGREIRAAGQRLSDAGVVMRAVYIGGGTPTFLTAQQLGTLMSEIRENFALSPDCEFTVEGGRPDTLTEEKIDAVYSGGATRISVNPQSFSNRVLASIGRSHSAESVYDAYRLTRKRGDWDINMDLIAGLPGDTVAGFAQSVASAVSLSPENITVHTLAMKKGSAFAERHQSQLSPELIAGMLEAGWKILRDSGYAPYYLYRQKYSGGSFENIGWAREGHICRYNIYMMEELLPVAACGAGAVTKLTDEEGGRIVRITNPKYPGDYCSSIEDIIDRKRRITEFYARSGVLETE